MALPEETPCPESSAPPDIPPAPDAPAAIDPGNASPPAPMATVFRNFRRPRLFPFFLDDFDMSRPQLSRFLDRVRQACPASRIQYLVSVSLRQELLRPAPRGGMGLCSR